MKLFVFAVIFVVLVAHGLALDCYQCLPRKAGDACEVTSVICPKNKNACAAAKFLQAPYGHYQKCMAMSDCQSLKLNAYINIKCCQDDFCNTF